MVGWELHDLTRRDQWSSRFLPGDHEMAKPRSQAMAGIVALRPQFRGGAECIGDTLGGALVVSCESNAHMAVVEDGVIWSVRLIDLVQGLRDEESAQAIAGQEREWGLEEVEPAERREFVEHQQQPVSARDAVGPVQRFGQTSSDLIE